MNLKNINQNFTQKFPGDFSENTMQRQTPEVLFCFIKPAEFQNTNLIDFNENLSVEIGLGALENDKDFLVAQNLPSNVRTYATAYAGHQFGNWAGQLGDGRAIYAGEIINENHQTEIQWKGAGATPYSRHADGRAVLRSSIREYLMSEAMFHLGIPTTRALSISKTGEDVIRDIQYSGNPQKEQGAVVVRTAESFLRFGHFELLSARNQTDLLKQLADYTIENFYPEVNSENNPNKYIDWFQTVCDRTLKMIIDWYRVGFVHGVMNTDNMSILGLTIDYGPYGWLEDYDPDWTPNTTDAEGRRYRFRNQPDIALWNLVQLGNALYPLIEDIASMEQVLNSYSQQFDSQFPIMQQQKLGLQAEYDADFQDELITLLTASETDMTIFYRNLANVVKTDTSDEALAKITFAFYQPDKIVTTLKTSWLNWMELYLEKIKDEALSDEERKQAMNTINPKYVLRNYMAQLAIEAAEKEDYTLIDELYTLLKNPYDEQPQYEKWFAKRPDWARHKVGCSMLSCSS